jgi:hypothetical protein
VKKILDERRHAINQAVAECFRLAAGHRRLREDAAAEALEYAAECIIDLRPDHYPDLLVEQP